MKRNLSPYECIPIEMECYEKNKEYEEDSVRETSKRIASVVREERRLFDSFKSLSKRDCDRQDFKNAVLKHLQNVYILRENMWNTCYFYKLAILVKIDFREFLSLTNFGANQLLPVFKLFVSVPDLFILYRSKPLELSSSKWLQTGGTIQLEENRGRHFLRVYMSPAEAYEKGSLLGWQLNEHYWTRHFRASRESMIQLICTQFSTHFLQQAECHGIKCENLYPRLRAFLHKIFPLELPDFLRGKQRIVVLKPLGSVKHHVGTNTVTSSSFIVTDVLNIFL